ncbi:hypothetical protein BJ138DRAFT_1186425 [Hygrophoropsis aurantiaca]|uniref:Uncharacterized protein n=1 Tax=Hygrophoropsis aurantiaca TaxID=72124 RepID=A0ACB7ZT47_9AGAM|nr:hypothetical protein BJ138DRAFT_1186425 [Hygrophoropsis aurantiaca]
MGRPAWANDTQWLWLKEQADRYLLVKGSKKTKDFWPRFFDDWQDQWPSPPLSTIINDQMAEPNADSGDPIDQDNGPEKATRATKRNPLTVKRRLQQWINNHTRHTSSGDGKQKLLDLSGKKPNRWQLYQAYSHLYYEKKLREIIKSDYVTYLKEFKEHEGEAPVPNDDDAKKRKPETIFAFRNRRLRELYLTETDEVKKEVEELREHSPTRDQEAAFEILMNEGVNEADVEERLRRNGTTANGQTFASMHPDWKNSVERPFNSFAHKCLIVRNCKATTPPPVATSPGSATKKSDQPATARPPPTDAMNDGDTANTGERPFSDEIQTRLDEEMDLDTPNASAGDTGRTLGGASEGSLVLQPAISYANETHTAVTKVRSRRTADADNLPCETDERTVGRWVASTDFVGWADRHDCSGQLWGGRWLIN